MVSPSALTLMVPNSPDRSRTTFESALRKQKDDFSRLEQQNFHYRIQIRNLTESLARLSEPKSPSAGLSPDNFYSFGDDQEKSSADPVPALEDDDPTIRRLRVEIADLREENAELLAKNDRLNDILDDLRDKAITERDEAQTKLKAQQTELQTLVNQGEDLQSEKLQLHIQLSQTKDQVATIQKEADRAKNAAEQGERRERALRTRTEGYKMQYDAAVAAMEEERKRAQDATDKVGLGNVEILELRKKLAQKAEEVDGLQRKISNTTRERDAIKEGLRRERERSEIWQDTAKFVEQGSALLEGGTAMETMMRVLTGQTEKYKELQYDPQWKDMIVNDLNECLRVLYQSQREVEAKRQILIDELGLETFATEGAATPSVS